MVELAIPLVAIDKKTETSGADVNGQIGRVS